MPVGSIGVARSKSEAVTHHILDPADKGLV